MSQRRCSAETQQGEPCRAFAPPDSLYCRVHDPARAAEVQAARSKGGRNSTRLRALQGRRRKLDSGPALAAFLSNLIHDIVEKRLDPELAKVIVYACSVQRSVVELVGRSEVERRLAEVERLLAQRRHG